MENPAPKITTKNYPYGLPTWPEFKPLWVNALRSGEYHQVFGSLCVDIKAKCMCATGVAGHILGLIRVPQRWEISTYDCIDQITDGRTVHNGITLLREVLALNDLEKQPFSAIADFLETIE